GSCHRDRIPELRPPCNLANTPERSFHIPLVAWADSSTGFVCWGRQHLSCSWGYARLLCTNGRGKCLGLRLFWGPKYREPSCRRGLPQVSLCAWITSRPDNRCTKVLRAAAPLSPCSQQLDRHLLACSLSIRQVLCLESTPLQASKSRSNC